MSRVLAQSIDVPGLVAGQRHGQHKVPGKLKRSVKMMSTLRSVLGLRLPCFSGLRTLNPLDTMLRPAQDFHSTVLTATATSSRRARASRCIPKATFQHFTEKSIKVIALACEEARRLGHDFVGTEHILLGLIGEGAGTAAKVLRSMGISLEDARVEAEKIIGRGSGSVVVEIPFTPSAKRVLELSWEEARQLGRGLDKLPRYVTSYRNIPNVRS